MLATLDRTDELLVLCGLDVPTLKNVRLALQTLELLSFPTNHIRFVLNRANSKVGLTKREIEAALKMEISHEIPSDRVVPICVNRGNPATLAEPGSDYAKAVLALAKATVATEQAKRQKSKRRGLRLSRSCPVNGTPRSSHSPRRERRRRGRGHERPRPCHSAHSPPGRRGH